MNSEWTRRHFLQALSVSAVAAGVDRHATAADWLGSDDNDRYRLVDPQLRAAIRSWHQISLPADLSAIRKFPLETALGAPAPPIETRHIPGPAGAPPVEVWICNPNPGRTGQPVFLHTHGGGYIAQNLHVFPFIQQIATACQCVVVSVNYRLAPEARYAQSMEDNYTALQWVFRNAKQLGVDRARIAVGGESAGGGHAAALAIHARDRGEIPLIQQTLIYPMLDDRTGSSRPVPASMGQFVWTASCNRYGWEALLGRLPGGADVPADAVPARAASVAGLPPAWIGVGSIDLFATEDVEYGRRLMEAGIPTELHVYPGAYHGFEIIVPDADVSKRFTNEWQAALRSAFSR